MSELRRGDDPATSASVGELVTRRLSTTDRWNLALVQRAEVWDELRMRHLLDSLLADYPIGAILLSTVREKSRVSHQPQTSSISWTCRPSTARGCG